MLLVLDSSVVIKWFNEEKDSGLALKLREDFFQGRHDFSVPDMLLLEVANALRFNKQLSSEDVSNAIGSLLELDMDVVVPSSELLEKAVRFAFDFDLTVYDAIYLALSDILKCTLVTEDSKLSGLDRKSFDVKTLRSFFQGVE